MRAPQKAKAIHEKSALSNSCKQSVHTNELVRRISPRLDWSVYVAPSITDYMVRMSIAGYNEYYRKKTLENSLRIYDKMEKAAKDG